jgi:cytochrome c-type biogenesis protein CcmF
MSGFAVGAGGRILLAAALGAAVWSVVASLLGARRRDQRLLDSGRRALYATTGLLVASAALLVMALFQRDFSLFYVANYSSRSTPAIFRFTALWAGMEGSLLFWAVLASIYSATAVMVQARRRPDLVPVATAVLAGNLAFFALMLVLGANPFAEISPIPADGVGLNPLLQSPFMAIHPVFLYLGLTGFSVPFAFGVAALVNGRLDGRWFTATRRWTLLSWSFLTVGIILGAAWAYMELGWGGYWAWDPVENASLMPWLTGTAFLHSVMIQERRGMLKIWNVALVLATYCLAIFGTFLTRSGILSSVHTFSESPLGKWFLPFLALVLIGSFGLLGWRFDKLRSQRHLDSVLSREAMFLFNNLLFVSIAFTVLWGTIYPMIVEAVQGRRISVGPAYFNAVVVPIGLALLALTGIGPLIAWRRASKESLKRQFALPLVVGALGILAMALAGVRATATLLAFGLCMFVASTIGAEFARGARAHRQVAAASGVRIGRVRSLGRAIARNRRRYGGYIVHLGVVLIVLGIAGSALKIVWSGSVPRGGQFQIGPYLVSYDDAKAYPTDEKMVLMAVLGVSRDGRSLGTLRPQRNFHFAQRQSQSEVALRSTLADDLYIVLTDMDRQTQAATIRAWVNPLVAWIWVGGGVMVLGMLVILSGRPPTEPARHGAQAPTRREEVTV